MKMFSLTSCQLLKIEQTLKSDSHLPNFFLFFASMKAYLVRRVIPPPFSRLTAPLFKDSPLSKNPRCLKCNKENYTFSPDTVNAIEL